MKTKTRKDIEALTRALEAVTAAAGSPLIENDESESYGIIKLELSRRIAHLCLIVQPVEFVPENAMPPDGNDPIQALSNSEEWIFSIHARRQRVEYFAEGTSFNRVCESLKKGLLEGEDFAANGYWINNH